MLHPTSIARLRAPAARRGAIGKGCLVALAVGVLLLLVLGGGACSQYNGLVASRNNVQGKWSEIDNQYKRRFDLVPNLVETVKGAAEFEKSTLESVTEARASVGRAQLPSSLPTDPQQLQAYIQAQQNLSGALTRLFAVAESYPQLKANQNFLSLQDQIEGTENRIATARRDYIGAVQAHNTKVQSFPANLFAGIFGFQTVPQLQSAPEERAVPKVEFDFKGEK